MVASPFVLAQQTAPGFDPSFLLMMGMIFVVFYFFIIRPQKKREAQRQAMISAVKKGDRIVTAGGIHGTVVRVDETSVLAQVDDNTKLRFEKSAIAQVAAKEGAPAA
ncbi:MAG TPA: preprotein translocase subunit YajC [Rubricoccaceae bacterium]|nr:preprotein translocase subunit YajC [Rubricoccaceae bacterium]